MTDQNLLQKNSDSGSKNIKLTNLRNIEYIFNNGDKITSKEKKILLNDGHITDNIIHCYASLIFDKTTYIMPPIIASKILVSGDLQRYRSSYKVY